MFYGVESILKADMQIRGSNKKYDNAYANYKKVSEKV